MPVPKKQREFFVSLMEATHHGDTPVIYDIEKDVYHGSFNSELINKLTALGAVVVVEGSLGETVMINSRDDFLSGFAAGANAARNGQDQYYADYNANPYAFSCGYEHYHYRQKKCKRTPYDERLGYVCHGFICDESEETYIQGQ